MKAVIFLLMLMCMMWLISAHEILSNDEMDKAIAAVLQNREAVAKAEEERVKRAKEEQIALFCEKYEDATHGAALDIQRQMLEAGSIKVTVPLPASLVYCVRQLLNQSSFIVVGKYDFINERLSVEACTASTDPLCKWTYGSTWSDIQTDKQYQRHNVFYNQASAKFFKYVQIMELIEN